MDISTSRVVLRSRNPQEALDVGVQLWRERKGLYLALWATFSLPVLLVLSLLFWQSPWWVAVLLWWLKPVFEAPILKVLSEQVFVMPGSYRQCVAACWRDLWRPRLIGDLTWRRLSVRRSLVLPITVLEQLDGDAHRLRRQELARYGDGAASWLTLFGVHLELIFTYGLLIIAYWLWFGNPVEHALVRPASMEQVGETFDQIANILLNDDVVWLYHLNNALYALVLCLWGPLFVAAGFGLYLQARTLSEAWDIRLAVRRLAARVQHRLPALFLLLALAWGGQLSDVRAETLPDAQAVGQARQQVLERPPFPHLKTENDYCWQSCADRDWSLPSKSREGGRSALVNVLLYALAAMLAVLVLWLAIRWLRRVPAAQAESVTAPETLFGLAITPQSLPQDVAGEVLAQWPHDARAAMSLLYRASLSRLHRRYAVGLKDSDTEGEILNRVHGLGDERLGRYWQTLTHAWLLVAYAHRQPDFAVCSGLCAEYRGLFDAPPATGANP